MLKKFNLTYCLIKLILRLHHHHLTAHISCACHYIRQAHSMAMLGLVWPQKAAVTRGGFHLVFGASLRHIALIRHKKILEILYLFYNYTFWWQVLRLICAYVRRNVNKLYRPSWPDLRKTKCKKVYFHWLFSFFFLTYNY